MLTWTLAFLGDLQMGHVCTLDPQTPHKHKCLHGKTNTHDSSSPQLLHILPFATTVRLTVSSPELLPQHDCASSSQSAFTLANPAPARSLTCASTSSRLARRLLAVASLLCARSRQIWFSIDSDFTRSSSAWFIFPILSRSSSLTRSRFASPCSIASTIVLACLFLFSWISNFTLSIWSSSQRKRINQFL